MTTVSRLTFLMHALEGLTDKNKSIRKVREVTPEVAKAIINDFQKENRVIPDPIRSLLEDIKHELNGVS